MPTIIFVLAAIVVLGLLLVTSTVKIVQEYERGVIFRLGRLDCGIQVRANSLLILFIVEFIGDTIVGVVILMSAAPTIGLLMKLFQQVVRLAL